MQKGEDRKSHRQLKPKVTNSFLRITVTNDDDDGDDDNDDISQAAIHKGGTILSLVRPS